MRRKKSLKMSYATKIILLCIKIFKPIIVKSSLNVAMIRSRRLQSGPSIRRLELQILASLQPLRCPRSAIKPALITLIDHSQLSILQTSSTKAGRSICLLQVPINRLRCFKAETTCSSTSKIMQDPLREGTSDWSRWTPTWDMTIEKPLPRMIWFPMLSQPILSIELGRNFRSRARIWTRISYQIYTKESLRHK